MISTRARGVSGAISARGRGGVGDLLEGHLDRVVPVEGQPPRQHLVHHDAHRVDVALGTGHFALGLFRADIVDAAHGLAGQQLVFGPGDAGDAEVHHPQLAARQQHDVLGLHVPVDHAVAVGVVQRLQDLGDKVDRLAAGQLAAPLVEVLAQGHAVDVLHHDILQPVCDRHVVHLDDVGVVEQ